MKTLLLVLSMFVFTNAFTQEQKQKSEPLPEGVTKEWLNNLRDENGNRISPETNSNTSKRISEDPENDALQRKIFNGINPGDLFGASVSDAGDVNNDGYNDIIVGASGYSSNTGIAYIFFGGVMMNTIADVTMTGEAVNNYFGATVASAGDVNDDGYDDVIVGASSYSSYTGRAYINFGGAAMNNVADVIMTGQAADNFFGSSVSSAGDVNRDGYSDVIIGAPGYSSYTGSAYVYLGGATMDNSADVTITGEAVNNFFGQSVSSAGDVNRDGFSDVIVGAPNYLTSRGRAYVYFGGVAMNNTADVIMTGEALHNSFGGSLSSAGDMNGDGYSDVIVGASGYSSNKGRAYVYFGAEVMNNVADMIMTGEAVNNFFGWSVSSADDLNRDGFFDVIVGAYGYSANTGRAYVFFGGSVMNNAADVIMSGEAAGDRFGHSVSSANKVNGDGYSFIIVGAYGYSSNTGRAYLFDYVMSNEIISDVTFTGEAANNFFGFSVSSAGDVNSDGYDDIIVGAHGYSSNTGRAYVFLGGEVINNVADVTMTGETTSNYFGRSVSSAGDVNGDGYDDVIVGADGYSSYRGKAYVFLGGETMNNAADLVMTGAANFNYFGASVSSAGDINNDGFFDVIVGAGGYFSNMGRAYVFLGGAVMNNAADVIMTGEAPNNSFGLSVSSAGDVNNDGFSDVIVGADSYFANTGRAYVFFGGAVMNNTADVIMTGETTSNYFGRSVSSAGDINRDGYSDVIVGAYGYSSFTGKAYIFFGGEIINNVADVTMTGEAANNLFGFSVSSAGDMNSDGFDDIIIGAYGYSSFTGRAYVYFGGAAINDTADVIMAGVSAGSFGYSVSSAGDVNGDSYSDVIAGAYGNFSDQGQADLYLASAISITPTLDLTMFIQGFYNADVNSQVKDTIIVELRNTASPFAVIDQSRAVVSANGTVRLKFFNAPDGDCYITLKHRNSIETWSANPIFFSQTTLANYDLSSALSQAFGNNMTQIDLSPLTFGIYGGDANQDGVVNLNDVVNVYNSSSAFVNGYVNSDMNGDNITNLTDLLITYNNAALFVSKKTP